MKRPLTCSECGGRRDKDYSITGMRLCKSCAKEMTERAFDRMFPGLKRKSNAPKGR